MQIEMIFARLAQNIATVGGLVEGITPPQARWKPSPDQWSILEVVNHLADEEVEDFRMRLGLLLENPEQPWPDIDPENWAGERDYNARNLAESLHRFAEARRASVAWLRDLQDPAWDTMSNIPGRPPMSAATLLACWVAHDWLHVRQMTRLQFAYLEQQTDPPGLDYAGRWT